MTAPAAKRPAAIRAVIPFVFRHWRNQPVLALATAGGLLGATVADLFMPVYSGRLVDAMTAGAADPAARGAAIAAFGAIVALGLASMILRLIGMQASSLTGDPVQQSLFVNQAAEKQRKLDRAVDAINQRIGESSVFRGGAKR